ncbi:hypothetical protein Bbelb_187410 [Branchiostoma belcheri]|nr:hypothetical protein Bbelb_187410 [Branchiostoma belcheri]
MGSSVLSREAVTGTPPEQRKDIRGRRLKDHFPEPEATNTVTENQCEEVPGETDDGAMCIPVSERDEWEALPCRCCAENKRKAFHNTLDITNIFPAVLTKNAALDKKCVTLMKPRTLGNSSSYIHQALEEVHSEEWAKRCLQYLSDCEVHMRSVALTGLTTTYADPQDSFCCH